MSRAKGEGKNRVVPTPARSMRRPSVAGTSRADCAPCSVRVGSPSCTSPSSTAGLASWSRSSAGAMAERWGTDVRSGGVRPGGGAHRPAGRGGPATGLPARGRLGRPDGKLHAVRGQRLERPPGGSGPSGHSSLFVLRRLPVTTLKIDRAFIAGLGRDDQDVTVVRSVLALAEGMEPVGRGLVSRRPNSCSRSAGDNYTVVLEEDERICLYLWDRHRRHGERCTVLHGRPGGSAGWAPLAGPRPPGRHPVDDARGSEGLRQPGAEGQQQSSGDAGRVSRAAGAGPLLPGLIKRQPVPVRMFTNETAAREWLHRPERRLDRAP